MTSSVQDKTVLKESCVIVKEDMSKTINTSEISFHRESETETQENGDVWKEMREAMKRTEEFYEKRAKDAEKEVEKMRQEAETRIRQLEKKVEDERKQIEKRINDRVKREREEWERILRKKEDEWEAERVKRVGKRERLHEEVGESNFYSGEKYWRENNLEDEETEEQSRFWTKNSYWEMRRREEEKRKKNVKLLTNEENWHMKEEDDEWSVRLMFRDILKVRDDWVRSVKRLKGRWGRFTLIVTLRSEEDVEEVLRRKRVLGKKTGLMIERDFWKD